MLLCNTLMPLANAQDMSQPTPTSSKSGNELDRVEVRGRNSDVELRRRSPVAKQVYGRDEIDKYGDTNVADVLKRLPGVDLQGGSPRMRGLGAGYTQILVNGDPAPPGFQLDQLDPSLVERIEVTKGPSAEHSAQAMAGTINIILRQAPRTSSKEFTLGLGRRGSPKGSARSNFTLNEKQGDLSYSIPIGLMMWNDVQTTTTSRGTTGLDGLPATSVQRSDVPSWGHGYHFMPRANLRINDDSNLAVNWFSFGGHWYNQPQVTTLAQTGVPRLDENYDQQGTWRNNRVALTYTNQFDDNQKIELKGGYNDSDNTYDNITLRAAPPQWRAVGSNGEHGVTQAGKYVRSLGDAHTLVVGWDAEQKTRYERREVTVGSVVQLPAFNRPFDASILRTALYAQDEWNITPQWGLSLGLRGERIATRSQDVLGADLSNSATVWTPLLHATYKFDSKGRDLIRMSLTRSYKAPTLAQMMARPAINVLAQDVTQTNTASLADFSGNPNLKPELATGLDVAYEKYLPGGGMFSVGGFYRHVSGLIRTQTVLTTVPWATAPRWVSMPTNFSTARTAGLEFEVKGRLGEWVPALLDPKVPLSLRAGLNVYRSSVNAVTGPNNRLEGQQPWSLTLGADYRMSGVPVMLGANLTYTPGYDYRGTDLVNTTLSAKRALDAFVMIPFNRNTMLRVGAMGTWALPNDARLTYTNGDYFATSSRPKAWIGAQLMVKF